MIETDHNYQILTLADKKVLLMIAMIIFLINFIEQL